MQLDVLYEDNHLLVVNKPAGLATIGVSADETSLAKEAKEYLRRRYHKPGNVYLGVVSRLDSLVTGAIVLARTSKAAARLTEQFRQRTPQKIYWALVPQPPHPPSGTWQDWLRPQEHPPRMRTTTADHPDAVAATLHYQTKQIVTGGALLEIELATGRKHQIRVQCAERELPIWGDRKYGSAVRFPHGIALHSRSLTVEHPTTQLEMTWVAPLPSYWPQQLRSAEL